MVLTLSEKERQCLHGILLVEKSDLEELIETAEGNDKAELHEQLELVNGLIQQIVANITKYHKTI